MGGKQLVAVRVVDGAGNLDLGLAGGGVDVVGKGRVEGRPVDKVDEVDAELGRVRVDCVPRQGKVLALGDGGVFGRAGKINGGDQGRRKGDEREHANHGDGRRNGAAADGRKNDCCQCSVDDRGGGGAGLGEGRPETLGLLNEAGNTSSYPGPGTSLNPRFLELLAPYVSMDQLPPQKYDSSDSSPHMSTRISPPPRNEPCLLGRPRLVCEPLHLGSGCQAWHWGSARLTQQGLPDHQQLVCQLTARDGAAGFQPMGVSGGRNPQRGASTDLVCGRRSLSALKTMKSPCFSKRDHTQFVRVLGALTTPLSVW